MDVGNDLLSVVSVDVLAVRYDPVRETVRLAIPRRTRDPFAGVPSLPGVVLQSGERLAEAAGRALAKFTSSAPCALGQLTTFDEPNRDPRGPSLSVAMFAVLPDLDPDIAVRLDEKVPALGFDHEHIIATCRPLLADRLWRDIAFTGALLPDPFSTRDARAVVVALTGEEPHPGNLNRLLDGLPGIRKTGQTSAGRGRPTTLRSLGARPTAG